MLTPNSSIDEQYRIPGLLLVALHLIPGIIFAGFFFTVSRVFIQYGLTSYLALLITVPACLAPIEIGVMLFWSVKHTGKISLSQPVAYQQQGTVVDYVALPLLLFVCGGLLSMVVSPVSTYIDTNFASWLPTWTSQRALISDLASSSPAQRTFALGLAVFLSGILAPLVEELYFRGFLLPRMEHWGWAAPVLNALLFAIYHFYFLGNVPGIFLEFLPVCFVAMLKKDWRIGAITHGLFNLWSVFALSRLIT